MLGWSSSTPKSRLFWSFSPGCWHSIVSQHQVLSSVCIQLTVPKELLSFSVLPHACTDIQSKTQEDADTDFCGFSTKPSYIWHPEMKSPSASIIPNFNLCFIWLARLLLSVWASFPWPQVDISLRKQTRVNMVFTCASCLLSITALSCLLAKTSEELLHVFS